MPLLLLIVIAPMLDAGQARPPDSPFARSYRSLVQGYRTGERDTSIDDVLALDHQKLVALVGRYVKLGERGVDAHPAFDRTFFRGASMLHAEAAFRSWERWRDEQAWSHLTLALGLVDVSEPPGAKAGSFRRRWYAATALILTTYLGPAEALAYFEDAVKKCPDDVPLLTAAGWFAERLSYRAAARGSSFQRARDARRIHQRTAERFLNRALEIDPNASEATLRLARLESFAGEDAQASARLTALLARADLQPHLAYVGRLILGGLHERRGDSAAAERLYREALALDRVAQSARVALARMLYATGDSGRAADILEPALRGRTERDRNDPWSDYQLAYPFSGRLLFDALHKEIPR
jgi:tetratricopeptide (TPR) repeat protein